VQGGEEEERGEGEEQAGAARDRRAQEPPVRAGVEERRRPPGFRHGHERASEREGMQLLNCKTRSARPSGKLLVL
jgi:hypothetical protein